MNTNLIIQALPLHRHDHSVICRILIHYVLNFNKLYGVHYSTLVNHIFLTSCIPHITVTSKCIDLSCLSLVTNSSPTPAQLAPSNKLRKVRIGMQPARTFTWASRKCTTIKILFRFLTKQLFSLASALSCFYQNHFT